MRAGTVLPPGKRPFTVRLALALLIPAAGMLLMAGSASAAVEYGKIVVAPQTPSVPEYTFTQSPPDGTKVSVTEILQQAADAGSLDMDTFPKITIGGKTLNRNQVMNAGGSLNVMFEADRTTINLPGGGRAVYRDDPDRGEYPFTPKIVVFPKAVNLQVTLSPKSRTVKSGASVKFTAKLSTAITGKVTYNWSFDDGRNDEQTTSPSTTHTFTGSDTEFRVTLTVTEEGNARNGTASSLIKIGKPAKKPKKKKKTPEKNNQEDQPAGTGDPYTGGYGDGGYGGYGSGDYGDGSYDGNYGGPSSPPTPATPDPKKKKPPVPVDDGLVPVRGELLDPDIPAQVIDSSTDQPQASAGESPQASDDPNGFALSGGAKTAIGIAVLLGIGGLTEFRSFARFR